MTRGAARATTLLAALLLARALLDAPHFEDAAPLRTAPPSGAARLLYGERLDPNREPAHVLALLPGIGLARAEAIVAARPHCSLAHVDRVPGVGPATLRVLAMRLTFRDPPSNCEHELRAIRH
jgi:DNA uptake protein ComE-like DNA-binding protein